MRLCNPDHLLNKMKRILLLLLFCISLIACTEEPTPVVVESIELELDTLTLKVGEKIEVTAAVWPGYAENQTVRWKSSDEAIAIVTSSAEYSIHGYIAAHIEAIAPGEATISVVTEDGDKTATCNLKVVDNSIPINSIRIEPSELTVSEGSYEYLRVVFDPYDATDQNIIWTTTDSTIATINDRKVYGVALGETKIKAETADGKHCAYCHVTVDIPRISQTLEFGPVSLKLEDVTTFSAKMCGTVDIEQLDGYDMDAGGIGIIYSKGYSDLNVDHAKKLELTTFGSKGEFSFRIEDLSYGTTYYYTIYLYKNGVLQYADKKSFTTEAVEFTVEEVTTTKTTAEFKGTTNLYGMPVGVDFGVLISKKEEFTAETPNVLKIGFGADNKTCLGRCKNLKYGTIYYYRTFIEQFDNYVYGDVQQFTTQMVDVSIEVDDVTQTTAVILGNIDVVPEENISIGVTYWKYGDAENNRKRSAEEIDESGNFTVELNDLLPSTEYQYNYYTYQNYEYVYGGTPKTFKTGAVPFKITAKNITQTTVTFEGHVELTEPESVEVGIRYSKKREGLVEIWTPTPDITQVSLSDNLTATGSYSLGVDGLECGQVYYYCYYLKQKGDYVFGEIEHFNTLELDFDIDSVSDLSADKSANCYIVSEAGIYKFRTVRGNSAISVGSVTSAAILWETFGTSTAPCAAERVAGAWYKDGYIAFQTADTFKEGNAVIAAKDAKGNILWSWHIWLTDQPQEHFYNNNAGTMMDRNLGATSATPGDAGALGLLYQWGRKDPFLGSSSVSSSTLAKSTITWPSAVSLDSLNDIREYVTAHPTTFISCNSSYDYWVYIGYWDTSSSDKSIYDPCPAGWRVPNGGYSGIWSKAGFDDTAYDSTNKGISFGIDSPSTTWYPASGSRSSNNGSLNNVGKYGVYWSCSSFSSSYAYYLIFTDGLVGPSYEGARAGGSSVRCLQE